MSPEAPVPEKVADLEFRMFLSYQYVPSLPGLPEITLMRKLKLTYVLGQACGTKGTNPRSDIRCSFRPPRWPEPSVVS